jgi:protein-disulfide isomerase
LENRPGEVDGRVGGRSDDPVARGARGYERLYAARRAEEPEMMDEVGRLAVPVNENDHVRGPDDAPITLVEYGDFECPYCGMAYPIVKAIEKRYRNVLRFVFRNFPLPQHPHAFPAAETAEYAADFQRFWPMHDMLFEHQRMLDLPHLLALAQNLDLDSEALLLALREGRYRPRIQAQIESGQESGVAGTPAFYINGAMFPETPSAQTFSASFDAILAHAPTRRSR